MTDNLDSFNAASFDLEDKLQALYAHKLTSDDAMTARLVSLQDAVKREQGRDWKALLLTWLFSSVVIGGLVAFVQRNFGNEILWSSCAWVGLIGGGVLTVIARIMLSKEIEERREAILREFKAMMRILGPAELQEVLGLAESYPDLKAVVKRWAADDAPLRVCDLDKLRAVTPGLDDRHVRSRLQALATGA